MNSNKITSLSLTESLKDFQRELEPLLELGKVEQWDGRTLLQREEKIRAAALILAGKCIVLLLAKLSKWDEAQERAVTQTQGWWRKKTRKNGTKEWTILTVGNVKVTLKLPFTEHLSAFAESAFNKDTEKKAWFKKASSKLKKGKSSELIQEMISLKKEAKSAKDSLTSEINHLIKLQKAERINYHLIAELKLPLGSGAIESLIRQAVNLRLKGNGK